MKGYTGPSLALGAAAVSGAGTMAVELAAVRLLAPWFGTDLMVWTNVIAAIMVALSLGCLLGARLSSGARPLVTMGKMLVAGATLVACLPVLAGPVASTFIPASIPLADTASLLGWGSLATSLLLFVPPAALLGAVSPLAVQAVQQATGQPAGRAGGWVLASSTLGSLVGVFMASLVLIPRVGIDATFFCSAALLGVLGGLCLLSGSPVRNAALALVPLGISVQGPTGQLPMPPDGMTLLAQMESGYQRLRVLEDGRAAPTLRFLQAGRMGDSFQSVWQEAPGFLPVGFYYNDIALPLAWTASVERRGPWNVLVLGFGAGTAWRILDGVMPADMELHLDGVEIDPGILSIASAEMGLDPDAPGLRIHSGLDARTALGSVEELNHIFLDCYANQVEIPHHLATQEFFAQVHATLAPGGWLTINVGGFGVQDPVVCAVAATAARAFGSDALLCPVPRARNVTVVIRRDAPLPLQGDGLLHQNGELWDRLVGPRAEARSWRVLGPDGGALLTDDLNPIQLLETRSIREARRWNSHGGGAGISDSISDRLQRARTLHGVGDLPGVLGLLQPGDLVAADGDPSVNGLLLERTEFLGWIAASAATLGAREILGQAAQALRPEVESMQGDPGAAWLSRLSRWEEVHRGLQQQNHARLSARTRSRIAVPLALILCAGAFWACLRHGTRPPATAQV